jgi:hypothetical protein
VTGELAATARKSPSASEVGSRTPRRWSEETMGSRRIMIGCAGIVVGVVLESEGAKKK